MQSSREIQGYSEWDGFAITWCSEECGTHICMKTHSHKWEEKHRDIHRDIKHRYTNTNAHTHKHTHTNTHITYSPASCLKAHIVID